jgi:ATP-dependent DNA helicase RecG
MNFLKLPINLDNLLTARTVEWERLEFKEGWNPETVGYIVIGVGEKNGSPVFPPKGISASQIDKIQKEILNLGHYAIQPSYHPLTARHRDPQNFTSHEKQWIACTRI